MTAPLAAPPYALRAVEFPCPGLASLVAKAPVGGKRESALACMTLARLACAVAPPVELSQELRRERAEGARAWLATLALDAPSRAALTRAFNTTGAGSRADVAGELEMVAEKLSGVLDGPSGDDLARIAQRLRQ